MTSIDDDDLADAIKEISAMPGAVEEFVTPKHRPLPSPLPVPPPLLPPRNADEVRQDAADEVPNH